MAVAEYFARQAFIVGSDGAAQVSNPAMGPFGADCGGTGAGAGLSARTGPVGLGAGAALGVGVAVTGGRGGESQAAAHAGGGPGFFGQRGFTASTTTGCRAAWSASPARPGSAAGVLAWRTVASICSMAPESVP